MNGLREYVKRDVKLQSSYSLAIAYKKALKYEKYLHVVLFNP